MFMGAHRWQIAQPQRSSILTVWEKPLLNCSSNTITDKLTLKCILFDENYNNSKRIDEEVVEIFKIQTGKLQANSGILTCIY